VLQCVAVCCSVLQCVAVCCRVCCRVCCSVLCSVLQCVAVCCSVCCSVLQCVAGKTLRLLVIVGDDVTCSVSCSVCCSVCCSVLQCVAVCCSVLQCVAGFTYVLIWLIRKCDTTHLNVTGKDSFKCVTNPWVKSYIWICHVAHVTHSHVRHEKFKCMT